VSSWSHADQNVALLLKILDMILRSFQFNSVYFKRVFISLWDIFNNGFFKNFDFTDLDFSKARI